MALLVFAALLIGFSLTSRRLERAWLTAPLVFTGAGWALAQMSEGSALLGPEALHLMAESALVLLLFHDASKLRLAELRANWALVARLLVVALPLVMVAGYGVAAWLLPGLGVGLTLFVAASLAPTDAALGAPTVLNPAVPRRVRSLLNAESGLNDGLATPVVLVALAMAAGHEVEGGGVILELLVAQSWDSGSASGVGEALLRHGTGHG